MKQYVIAGASSGIGLELASKLLAEGHKVIGLNRQPGPLEGQSNYIHYPIDFTTTELTFPALDGALDGLVYCPGSIVLKPFRSLKEEDYLSDFRINFLGAVALIKQYLPLLQQAQQASIVLFSTVAVQTGMAFHASIAASKGAVEGLCRSMAAEFAPKIRVNAIAPSLTQTPLAEKLLNTEQKIQGANERHPLKQLGTAHELASAAKWLLESNWVSGQVIKVDGGISSLR
ncbi:MAG: SDR family oxidoreductase [Bacteroidia bacterium]|nr:SDR family oxidoreductase [Bacteroidia bacterium]